MAQEIINIGTLPNDGTGDPVRVAFQKINNNFTQVYSGNTFSYVYGPEGSVQYKRVNNLQAVALNGNVYLATGYPSRFYTSTDLVDWTLQTPPTSNTIYSLISVSGNFYGVGENGTVIKSNNGAIYGNVISTGVTETLRGIAYDSSNTLFVTVGDSGKILTSTNGATWTLRTSGTTDNLNDVTFASNLGFVTVGSNGTALYSTNGTTWNVANSTVSEELYSITYNGAIFTAVGANGTIISSNLVSTWTDRTTSNVTVDLYSITSANVLGNLTFIAVGANGTTIKSTDGNAVVWTPLTNAVGQNLVDVSLGSNLFIATGANSAIISLPYGNTTWANVSVPPRMEGNANFIYDAPKSNLNIASNIIPQASSSITIGTANSRFASGFFDSIEANVVTSNLTLSNIEVTGYANLGNVETLTILGGNNGYFLQTDGAGSLTWAPAGNGGNGNGSPAGANTQVQFNDAGNFGGDAGFTYNYVTNVLTVNTISASNVTTLTANITSNLKSGNANLGNLATANYINVVWDVSANVIYSNYVYGDGSNLTNLPPVANANYASYAGNANTANTANLSNIANVAYSISGSNVSGTVANANYASYAGEAFSVDGANVIGNVEFANYAYHVDVESTTNNFSYHVVLVQNPGDNHLQIDGDDQLQYNPAEGVLTSFRVDANLVLANLYYSNGYQASNIVGTVPNANFAIYSNTVTNAAQPNITSVGNLTSLNVVGAINATSANISGLSSFANLNVLNTLHVGNAFVSNANSTLTALGDVNFDDATNVALGEVGKISILGGNNGYFLQTDGAGNLSWAAVSNGGGNATPGGANTQVQFNDGGSFGGNAGFTYNKSTTILTVLGTIDTNALSVTGNIAVGNAALGNLAQANFFQGSGNRLSNLQASNITGTVANANYAVYAEYANISNVINGTSNVAIPAANGNINLSVAGNANVLVVTGTGINAANATFSNIVANAANITLITGTLTTNAQPNITSLGNLTNLVIDGGLFSNTANVEGNGSFGNLRVVDTLEVDTNLIVNASGTLTVLGNVNFDDANLVNLGEVDKITIYGGSNGYVLTTDGTGNLSWTAGGNGGGGNTVPGGANTQVQFNDSGSFGGNSNFTFNKGSGTLTVVGHIASNTLGLTGNLSVGNAQLGVIATAGIFNGSGNQLSNLQAANITGTIANANYSTYAGTVLTNAQPNITSVGTLTGLSVVGNIATSNLAVTANVTVGTKLSMNANSNLTSSGTVHFTNSPNVTLGDSSTVHILGGTNGYFLQTDGTGNLTWAAAGGGGGNGTPGGINKQVQFNDSGAFGGNPNFTFDKAVSNVTVAGNVIANGYSLGIGLNQFSYSNVYFASTLSNAANQEIYAISTANLAGIDFTIISDDSGGNIRNISKISAIVLGSTVNYNETSTLAINGYTGDFSVVYSAGNILTGPQVQLLFSPQSSNLTTHKMMITTLRTT